ncbi:MAG: sulfite exporter TauE/SafE family protein [Acidibrevibacterium sp.]|uniref:sulfite exporter TauE/SafE family protein n=1 Tax=Acidibrevibacterium sp. TaxID=2606776 RepID=UPI003D077B9E
MAGAVGSVAHCGPMCGPFVLGQVAGRLARVPATGLCERHRIAAGLVLPYHLGRISVYALLGALVAAVGVALAQVPWLARLGGIALVLAALLFADQAVRQWFPRSGRAGSAQPRGVLAWLWRRASARRGRFGEFAVGAALGFLPCGFLYAALAVAAGSGAIWRGALAMAIFGLGTMPALIVVGIMGSAAGRAWESVLRAASPVMFAANALLLLILGGVRLWT